MAEANAAADNTAVEDKQAIGAPAGVTNKDLSEGETSTGAKPPATPSNEPPKKEPTAEEKAAADKAEADKKAADEKAAADKEAADKLAAEEAEKNKEPLLEYPTYDDPTANSVVNLLKKAGVTPDESDKFFRKAVESGNLDDVDVTALAEKVGKDEADLIMIGVKKYYSDNVKATNDVVAEVYKTLGGEEQTNTLIAWALEKEKTDAKFGEDLNEYRKMLDGTPTQARLAAQELLKAYNADPKTKSLSVNITHGDKPGSGDASLEYINRQDYVKALTVAEAKRDKSEVARLNARRKVSMAQEKAGQR